MDLIKKITLEPGLYAYRFRPQGNFHEKVIEFFEKAGLDDDEFTALLRDDGDWDHEAEYYTMSGKDELIEFLKDPKVSGIDSVQVFSMIDGEDAIFTVKYNGGGESDCRVFALTNNNPDLLKMLEDFN